MIMSLLRTLESGLLLGAGFFLKPLLPFVGNHAIDDFARLVFSKHDILFPGRLPEPVTETVPAKSGQNHHIDILHIATLAQMVDKPAKYRRLYFRLGHVIHRILFLASANPQSSV